MRVNKIVWVMGESAVGKATFIRYALANPGCTLMRQLGYHDGKIIPVIENNDRSKIKNIVLDLLDKEKDAIVLIKWQAADSIYPQGDGLLKTLAAETPDTPREIILLSAESDVLYARAQRKPWWNKPDIPYSYYTQERQDENTERTKSHAKELSTLGFKLVEIDSTDGYRFLSN